MLQLPVVLQSMSQTSLYEHRGALYAGSCPDLAVSSLQCRRAHVGAEGSWGSSIPLTPSCTTVGFHSQAQGCGEKRRAARVHLGRLFSISPRTKPWLHHAQCPPLHGGTEMRLGPPARDSRSQAPKARAYQEGRQSRWGQLKALAPALFVRLLSWTPKPLDEQTSPLQQTPAPVSLAPCNVLLCAMCSCVQCHVPPNRRTWWWSVG